ncbi:MAG: arginine--tRNA ligase [Phycisphaerae bacterium]
MKSILGELSRRVQTAMAKAGFDGDPLVRPSQDEKFGHYQSNCAMGLAKKVGKKPREVAGAIVEQLDVDDMAEDVQIAGPGFINLRIKPSYLARSLQQIPPCADLLRDRLGIPEAEKKETVVVDLASPNLAKEMHVGHLRSSVIGDCVARLLEFQGHTVHRESHVGDWGTQFGMLIAHLRSVDPDVVERPDELVISDLETFYVDAKRRFDADEGFQNESREAVVALQGGDETTLKIWRAFCDESLRHCHEVLDRLGAKVVDRGESVYADLMPEVVRRLEEMRSQRGDGFVQVSDGALCLFMEGYETRDGDTQPLIVRKSDGGFNYATSDLAAIIQRVEEMKADRILYVVGLQQKQHFAMVFDAARQAGWVSDDVVLQHLGFGYMLSPTGQPFKTREGGTVKLSSLLDEAVDRARKVVEEAQGEEGKPDRGFTPEQIQQIAETVGLGAVRYFDLSHSLTSDYRFDLDTMLSLDGNTAPYMLYAYARIRSIGRKAGIDFATLPADARVTLEHPSEINLALKILQFAETLDTVSQELKPNVLTEYLYDLAKAFSRFYDKKLGVRVIDASPEDVRTSRLRLCDATARVLRLGLHLLGINTLEQM